MSAPGQFCVHKAHWSLGLRVTCAESKDGEEDGHLCLQGRVREDFLEEGAFERTLWDRSPGGRRLWISFGQSVCDERTQNPVSRIVPFIHSFIYFIKWVIPLYSNPTCAACQGSLASLSLCPPGHNVNDSDARLVGSLWGVKG